jgi:predicted transcriptional regulator
MTHRGDLLKSAMTETKTKVAELAKYLDVTRHTVYSYLADPLTNIDVLLKCGKYMKYDIISKLPEFAKANTKESQENLEYKMKYFELTEKMLMVMEENNALKSAKKRKS